MLSFTVLTVLFSFSYYLYYISVPYHVVKRVDVKTSTRLRHVLDDATSDFDNVKIFFFCNFSSQCGM